MMRPDTRKFLAAVLGMTLLAPGVSGRLASASAPSVAGQREPAQLDGNPLTFGAVLGAVWSVAFAPDGKSIAAVGGGWDKPGDLVIWDAAAGKPRARLRVNPGLRSVAVSRDGKLLATAGYSESVAHVRDAATGKVLRVLQHNAAVNGVALSRDGRCRAAAGAGCVCGTWRAAAS